MPQPTRIAILGGGLTGLSAAFHAARRFPRAQVVLFERQQRVGGWVHSQRVEVAAQDRLGKTARASVLLESGPRTLRPGVDGSGRAVLELINLLGLQDSLITTPSTSPAAKNRFLYVPGRHGLNLVPASLVGMLKSPYLASVMLPAVMSEPLRSRNRGQASGSLNDAEWDESVDSFLSRRFGAEFARVMGSALVHGIYASDSRELSVRSTFPTLIDAEDRGKGSVVRGFARRAFGGSSSAIDLHKGDLYEMGDISDRMKGVSVYSFADGLQTLPRAIVDALTSLPNVTIKANTEIRSVCPAHEDVEIHLNESDPLLFSHVISALPLSVLSKLTSSSPTPALLPHLTANNMASVTVVHLIFPPSRTPIHPPGFGYLVSRPAHGYGPDPKTGDLGSAFLGAVFDSSSVGAQDRLLGDPASIPDGTKEAGFTKMTVMLGGPHPLTHAQSSIPAILQHLSSHLQTTLPTPVYSAIHRHENCIPTYGVGHLSRMRDLKRSLDGPVWAGRLKVVGAGVGGVSVGDCVDSGRNSAMSI